ncbi:hypothetical protein PMIT1313_02224 [Prochlorococcus marinus str. MIT 1313]|nr:hypothetical protein PMIT1313_02224 [Prochlorococcus marinus str. MIT 1313]KZR71161.1 hypothetical protein PMIT1318_02304 [Prochlorococcus marinus str. MIT 1318]
MHGFWKVSSQAGSALFSWSLFSLGMVFGGSLVFISAAEDDANVISCQWVEVLSQRQLPLGGSWDGWWLLAGRTADSVLAP